ncbi:MAG TPA: glycerol-3-phosphate dehydrogenase, partial [Burkholderiaceae bacterium]|nr:glycerol-3-phosphate dehydrogenase [Burkholderiaceae bacterium]
MRIAIFGAGAWGTALAVHASGRHPVTLWARDESLVASLRRDRRNERYLPGVDLPPQIEFADDAAAACRWLDAPGSLAVVATPVAGLRDTLRALDAALPG